MSIAFRGYQAPFLFPRKWHNIKHALHGGCDPRKAMNGRGSSGAGRRPGSSFSLFEVMMMIGRLSAFDRFHWSRKNV